MVHIAPLHKPGVVISGGSIDNIGIHIVMGKKLQSLVYDGLYMIPPMSLIEGIVSGNNLPSIYCLKEWVILSTRILTLLFW